jgi:hypothetical protein
MKAPERRVEVILSLAVVNPLVDVIRGLVAELREAPPLPHAAPDSEPDFNAIWSEELVAGRDRDVDVLLSVFDGDFSSEGKVCFDSENAAPFIRACSAVRLCLRERRLAAVTDEALESGDMDGAKLDVRTQKAFLCYLFLATLQELVIQRIEDGSIG